MRRHRATRIPLGLLLLGPLALAADDAPPKPALEAPAEKSISSAEERLSMSPPVACRSINGFEDYEPLPDAALTADEKLLVYYRPSGYRVENTGGMYRIHLTQDGQIRRRGEKPVLMRKNDLLDYDWKKSSAPNPVFLRNTVSLKGLKPGDYDFDIILHDKLGASMPATITLPFKVIPATLPTAGGDADKPADEPGTAPAPAPGPKSKARTKPRPKGRRPVR